MYVPFAMATNYALGHLSGIEVDGLPPFKTHIAFVPCNQGVQSDHVLPASSFKPDIVVMSLQDVYKLYGVDQTGAPNLSTLIAEITETSPSNVINWKSVLSAVEMKRKPVDLPELGVFTHQETQVFIPQDVDKQLDEKPENSSLVTCKTNATLWGVYTLT